MASKSLWLRLYTEVLNDPKVQRLDGDTFKGWVNLLCVAKESSGNGTLPTLSDIAFYLRTDANTAGQLVQRLIEAGLIDYDGERYVMHGWNQRQYESDNDPTATERKRRERDRKRDVTDNVTDMSRVTSRMNHGQCHANVTRTETETETEKETDKYNIRERSETLPAPKTPTAAAAPAAQPLAENSELYNKIKKTFETVHGDFANYAKEGSAIKRIIKLTKGDESAIGLMLKKYHELTESGDKFWGKQPYIPSALLALWDRVKAEGRADATVDDIAWVEEGI
jgi:hypothetical protein